MSWNAGSMQNSARGFDWSSDAIFWALAFGFALYLVFALKRVLERRQRRGRALRALSAERRAARLLHRAGYSVQATQVARRWPVVVGHRCIDILLRADYLVARGAEVFVAEVKSGAYVARVRHGPTRRQLLEYQLAYDVDGVLLVDVERQRVQVVRFPALGERTMRGSDPGRERLASW